MCIVYVNCKNPFAFALHFLICEPPIHPFPLLRTFTMHRTKGEGRGYLFNFFYHFHPLHRLFDISRNITSGSSPLHIA